MIRRTLPFLASALFLFACAAPRTTVKTEDQSGTLRFNVQPGSAEVVVDGRGMGKAREYDGTAAVLKLPPGSHAVKLQAAGYEDYETNVYLSNTQELIEINMKEKQ